MTRLERSRFKTTTRNKWRCSCFSNIIKSPVSFGGGKPGKKGLEGALGLNGYLKVYNYNRGSTIEDIALEFISDPLNWFSLDGDGATISEGAAQVEKNFN